MALFRRILLPKKKKPSGVQPPVITITAQPQNQSVSSDSASFSVTASVTQGATLSYQWQRSTDNGSNFSSISGETSSTLSLSGLTVSSDNYQYRVVVSAPGATNVVSSAALLEITPVISISAQPSNQSTSNGSASFSVTADTGVGATLSYQWQQSTDSGSTWSNLSGETSSSLSLSGLTVSSDSYQYRVVISGTGGYHSISNVTSSAATLNVVPVISISAQPSNQSAVNGSASFSVTASASLGGTLSYQWQRSTDAGTSWSNLAGATSSSLSLSSLTVSSHDYRYRVVLSANYNASNVTSASATLSVVPVVSISAQPSNQSTSNGSATFSVTASINMGGTLSYQWQRSTDAGTSWSNLAGATSSSLSLTSLTVTSDQYRYRVIVSGSNNASSVTSNSATLSVVPVVSISAQPSNQSTTDGNATFSVTASITLSGTLSYQWQLSTNGGSTFNNIVGATSSSLSLSSLTVSSHNYRYRCVVSGSNNASSVTSNSATLTVNSTITISSQPANFTTAEDASTASFSVTASASLGDTLTYQWQRSLDNGSTWANVTVNASGMTTATLSLTGVNATGTYAGDVLHRCVVSASRATSVNSNSASLAVVSSINQTVSAWIGVGAGGLSSPTASGLAWGPERNILVMSNGAAGASAPAVFSYSSNGLSWTASSNSTAVTGLGSGKLCYGSGVNGGTFVSGNANSAVAADRKTAISTDGINWTISSNATTQPTFDIAYSPTLNMFASVSRAPSTSILTSTDGLTWTARSIGATGYNFMSIVWNSTTNEFFAIAANRWAKSSDGINWTTGATTNSATMVAFAYSPTLQLYVGLTNTGTGNRARTSSDGATWTTRNTPTPSGDIAFQNMVWSPELSLFVAVANASNTTNIITSPDGINWTMRTGALNVAQNVITWSPALKRLISAGFSTNKVQVSAKYPS